MPMKDIPLPEEELSLCQKSGELTRAYKMNGFDCPVVVLDDQLARRQAGYTLIDLDLEDVESWLSQAYGLYGPQEDIPNKKGKPVDQYLLTSEDHSLRSAKALWFSAIVVYAKCFTQADGRGVKLERENVPDAMKECHDKIMNYRHTIVAHAGVTNLETAPLEIILSPPKAPGKFFLKNNCKRIEFSDDRNEPVTFTDLVNAVHESVRKKRDQLTAKILERTQKLAVKELYKKVRPK
jgi:hypothetical protein